MKKLLHLLTALVIYIVAVGSVFAAGDGVAPIKPDQTDIRFIPYPKDNLPENIAKGTSESVFLRPVHTGDTVYYRILSVEGADQTSPIGKTDVKVERHEFGGVKDYVPIQLTEDLVNADGQFVVKAATLRADGVTWSENVTAAYNVVFGEHVSATKLAFEAGEPTELMVGESYEMQLSLEAPEDSLTRYGNASVNLIINWEGGIDFADVQYKFAEADEWTSVDPDDLTDLIRIPNTFKNFDEKGVWVKLVMSRIKRSDEMWMELGITQGNSFMDGKAISSVIDMTVPCVDRPAADPVFSPAAGYVAKGSTVTISSATNGASVRYTTDGTEPTATTGTLYENPVTINGLTTIKAVAVTDDGGTSFVSEAVYSVVGIPQITPASGRVVYDSLVKITLSEGASTEGVKFYYTTDGTEPSATSTEYTAPFKLRDAVIKVIAIQGDEKSPVVTREYTLLPAKPTATPAAGKIPYGTKVKLECATDGAEIYWRIGGNSPVSTSDTRYTEEIEIKQTCLLKAIAYYNGQESQSVSFSYTVTLAAPEFSIPEGEVPEGARVIISSKSVEANTNPNKQVNIAYTLDGTEPTKENVRDLPKYKDAIEITETVTIKAMTWTVWTQGLEVSEMSTVTYTVGADNPDTPVLPETVKAPTFEPAAGEVEKGAEISWTWDEEYQYDVMGVVYVANGTDDDLDIDAAQFMELVAAWDDEDEDMVREDGVAYLYYEGVGAYNIEKDATLKARLVLGIMKDVEEGQEGENPGVEIALSPIVEAAYTVKGETPAVTLTFNPATGTEVDENTAVTITCSDATAEIFYMMFESEAAAKAAEWNQEEALSYSSELKPVLSKEKTTIKAAYALEGAEAVAEDFFYATYTVKELPAIELTFNPADGSEVEDNTTVTVTANREVEIFYNLYADKAAADADKETFMGNAKEVTEDGMPVITKAAPYLLCAVTDRGEMKYFDATYTVKGVANEDEEELAGVTVYPNPTNGQFNLELPVAATVEVFMSNGVLYRRVNAAAGSTTLNIERSGIYFLRITGEGRTVIKRVIVR